MWDWVYNIIYDNQAYVDDNQTIEVGNSARVYNVYACPLKKCTLCCQLLYEYVKWFIDSIEFDTYYII